MTREEIEEFIEGIEGITGVDVLEGPYEILLPGIDNGFIGWDGWEYRAVYDWKLCHMSLIKDGRSKEEAEDHLNQLRQQSVDRAKEEGVSPPVFVDMP